MEICQCFHAKTGQVHSDPNVCSENAEGMLELLTIHLYCLISFYLIAFLWFQWKYTNVSMLRPAKCTPKRVFRECQVNPGVTDNTFILPDPFVTYILLAISMEICQCFHAETGQVPSDSICVFWECQGNAGLTIHLYYLISLLILVSLWCERHNTDVSMPR